MEEMINNEKRECALRMLADRELSLEKIAKYSNLTLEQVKELLQLKEDAFKIFMENGGQCVYLSSKLRGDVSLA